MRLSTTTNQGRRAPLRLDCDICIVNHVAILEGIIDSER
jgi:hypothetical protein